MSQQPTSIPKSQRYGISTIGRAIQLLWHQNFKNHGHGAAKEIGELIDNIRSGTHTSFKSQKEQDLAVRFLEQMQLMAGKCEPYTFYLNVYCLSWEPMTLPRCYPDFAQWDEIYKTQFSTILQQELIQESSDQATTPLDFKKLGRSSEQPIVSTTITPTTTTQDDKTPADRVAENEKPLVDQNFAQTGQKLPDEITTTDVSGGQAVSTPRCSFWWVVAVGSGGLVGTGLYLDGKNGWEVSKAVGDWLATNARILGTVGGSVGMAAIIFLYLYCRYKSAQVLSQEKKAIERNPEVPTV